MPEKGAALKASAGPVAVRAKIWLERDGKVVLSDWRVKLLQAIGETGSLAQAAESMGVPYRTAWYKLKEVEEQVGVRLLETRSGGAGGGGTVLTAEARDILERFERVYADVATLVQRRFESEFGSRLR